MQGGAELEGGKTGWGQHVGQWGKEEQWCAGEKRRAMPRDALVQQGPEGLQVRDLRDRDIPHGQEARGCGHGACTWEAFHGQLHEGMPARPLSSSTRPALTEHHRLGNF